jgi:predicted phage tail protein
MCCLLVTGCIPAHEPDNLRNTPGPSVVIDNNTYSGAIFSASVPAGWRVITGEAQAPQSVIFVAPDGKTLIRLIEGKVDEAAVTVANQRNEIAPVTLANSTLVTAVFSSPYSTWASYYPAFEQVRDSLSSR